MSETRIANGFKKYLNRHGYAFQFSLLKEVERLFQIEGSSWNLEASEFPVEVRAQSGRIDFVLRHSTKPALLIAECKRADPALKDWCFARAPYVRRGRQFEPYIVDAVYRSSSQERSVAPAPVVTQRLDEAFYLGFEIRGNDTGDSSGSGRNAIEEASSQVMRSVNGLIEFLVTNEMCVRDDGPTLLLPVVFTTARLWVSDIDLSGAEVATGLLPESDSQLEERPWLFYQFPASPGLKHSLSTVNGTPASIAGALDMTYTRTIAVVNSTSLQAFLTAFEFDVGALKYGPTLDPARDAL